MSLHLRNGSWIAAAMLLAATPLLAGQQAGKPQQEKPGKPVAAAAAQHTVLVAVDGLTQEASAKVQTELSAMTHAMWVCPGCEHMQAEKGTCASCKKDLVSKAMHVLGKVTADAKAEALSFSVNEGMHVRLSELERTLAKEDVKVDPARLALAGGTTLYIQGPATPEATAKLEAALKSSKLFEQVDVQHKADSKDYHVLVVAAEKVPSHADVAKAIERVGDGFKLTDVGWFAPKRVG